MPLALGIDPGFAHLGFAIVDLDDMAIIEVHHSRTKKSSKTVTEAQDRHDRLKLIQRGVSHMISMHRPKVAVVETPLMIRNVKAATAVHMAYGAILALLNAAQIPVVLVSAQDLKEALTGSRSASKAEVMDAVVPHMTPRALDQLANVAKTHKEHPVDAAGSVLSVRDHQVIQLALQMS